MPETCKICGKRLNRYFKHGADIYCEEHKPDNLEPTLCINCKHADAAVMSWGETFVGDCLAENAPYTDFVGAKKNPRIINKEGHCQYFNAKD